VIKIKEKVTQIFIICLTYRAMTLSPDPDIKYQRGLILYQMKNYRRALKDFNIAAGGDVQQKASLYNYIGMCEGQVGCSQASLDAHLKALQIDPNFKEAKLNFAQIHKDLGHYAIADAAFKEAIAMDTSNTWIQGQYVQSCPLTPSLSSACSCHSLSLPHSLRSFFLFFSFFFLFFTFSVLHT
jgi:tetratricopeptide (TPR) repeat protein